MAAVALKSATAMREDRIALGIAVALHLALGVALIWQPDRSSDFTPPERVVVSLASEVSLESTAPDPSAEPAASQAPEIADAPEPAQLDRPEPVTPPPPRPVATSQPQPRPSAQPTQQPRPQPSARPTASRLGENFLEGNSDASGTSGSAAAVVGPAQRASIAQAISRQLKPHWTPPSGVEVERLVTVVRFRLNTDGSLSGAPEVLRTDGVTDANRPQVNRHQEQAIRAVRLAAPFDLPEEYYSGWRVITSNFDNRLAQ